MSEWMLREPQEYDTPDYPDYELAERMREQRAELYDAQEFEREYQAFLDNTPTVTTREEAAWWTEWDARERERLRWIAWAQVPCGCGGNDLFCAYC